MLIYLDGNQTDSLQVNDETPGRRRLWICTAFSITLLTVRNTDIGL